MLDTDPFRPPAVALRGLKPIHAARSQAHPRRAISSPSTPRDLKPIHAARSQAAALWDPSPATRNATFGRSLTDDFRFDDAAWADDLELLNAGIEMIGERSHRRWVFPGRVRDLQCRTALGRTARTKDRQQEAG